MASPAVGLLSALLSLPRLAHQVGQQQGSGPGASNRASHQTNPLIVCSFVLSLILRCLSAGRGAPPTEDRNMTQSNCFFKLPLTNRLAIGLPFLVHPVDLPTLTFTLL
eukprot:4820591-Amphidinium_carterae.1